MGGASRVEFVVLPSFNINFRVEVVWNGVLVLTLGDGAVIVFVPVRNGWEGYQY